MTFWVHLRDNEHHLVRRIEQEGECDEDRLGRLADREYLGCDCARENLWLGRGLVTNAVGCGVSRFTITCVELPDGTNLQVDPIITAEEREAFVPAPPRLQLRAGPSYYSYSTTTYVTTV